MLQGKRAIFLILNIKMVLFNIIWFTLSTTVLECMAKFMGYNVDWFRLHGFISDYVSRNTRKSLLFWVKKLHFILWYGNIWSYSDISLKAMHSVVFWILSKTSFFWSKFFGILFGKYFELRKSIWAPQCTYIQVSDSQIWSKVHPRYYYFVQICEKIAPNSPNLYGFSISHIWG